jgi:hypothetical protein
VVPNMSVLHDSEVRLPPTLPEHLVVPNMSVLHEFEVRLPPTLPEHLVVPNMSVLHDCPDGDVRVIGAGVFSGAELEVEAAEA